ncbi:tetraspanin-6 [Leptinotarsa decemlineata]|uniref:tetraspanin-6 n=1 Tax=Leptinotarsa decemlineata TaxID=7539 RepID=UPI000C2517AF|nr:tetraspanin-6-like [Leptinotarsa decemlineata]
MLKKTHSAESWEMPWNVKWKKNNTLVVPQSESGRNVNETCFLLCFISVLCLSSSMILICLSIWSLVRKFPYFYLVDIKTDVPYFTLPAGILGIPTSYIAASIHNKKNIFRLLLLLIFLITLSTILLVTGAILGFMYSLKIDLSPSILVNSIENEHLNQSVHSSFLKINASISHKNAWDKTQRQLECCGVNSYLDWSKHGMQLPNSCCSNAVCTSNNTFFKGCLDALSRDLVWHRNILKSHAYITILLQLILVVLTTLAYILKIKK